MRRIHLFEVIDLDFCPQAIRDGVTDWVQFMYNTHKAFNALAPKLRRAMDSVGTKRVVDMCSGGGGPWLELERALSKTGEVEVLLTDFYPNIEGSNRLNALSGGRIRMHPGSVDATNVPPELEGVRTVMNGFHHLRPEQAQAVLADAVKMRRPIAIFEGTDSKLRGTLVMLFMPLLMLLMMPLVRPFRWSRLFLTYVIPILPLLGLWDGTISMLRTYTPEELREMVARIPGSDTFDWDIGTQAIPKAPIGMTFLVGTPR